MAAINSGRRPRPVQFGVNGQADITGIARGWRLEIEVKTATGRQSEPQERFEGMIKSLHGIYLLVRSEEEATRMLSDVLWSRAKGME